MSCSCHISPPCNHCIDSYNCHKCDGNFHPDDRERVDKHNGVVLCLNCAEEDDGTEARD